MFITVKQLANGVRLAFPSVRMRRGNVVTVAVDGSNTAEINCLNKRHWCHYAQLGVYIMFVVPFVSLSSHPASLCRCVRHTKRQTSQLNWHGSEVSVLFYNTPYKYVQYKFFELQTRKYYPRNTLDVEMQRSEKATHQCAVFCYISHHLTPESKMSA